ncbi:MAG: cold shock domain-containing protein [Bacteroidia bacterium]|jgi:CspA family cold shock protein|nr:cold shock domain-containing protein [Phycisphaerae bacterium]MBU6209421.1 cold shock domain-containing protein [Planctomycetota bacterium]MDI9410934.1 cold shock domain-containing protein [Bacteroidia bacterium]
MTDTQKIENAEGTIKWFDARKGFGFIIGPQGQDIFVHFTVIDQETGFRTFKDGEKVTYSANCGAKGWSATFARSAARVTTPQA